MFKQYVTSSHNELVALRCQSCFYFVHFYVTHASLLAHYMSLCQLPYICLIVFDIFPLGCKNATPVLYIHTYRLNRITGL
jgi:hypothetical protein